jgi:urease subunit gamma/beta
MATMRLTAWEEQRLLIFGAAELARRHRAAGLPLNAPEVVALIADAMLEAARSGGRYEDVEAAGLGAVAPGDVMEGVRELVDEVRLEVLLGDGTRLIVLVDPLGRGQPPAADGPGAIVAGPAVNPADDHRERRRLSVRSESRRTIEVSSHLPFDRANHRLRFDREAAAGFHLDLPAGDHIQWLPGQVRVVSLVRFGGSGDDSVPAP